MVLPDQTVQKEAAKIVSGKDDGTFGYLSGRHFTDTNNVAALNGRIHALSGYLNFKYQVACQDILKECCHATVMGQ